MYTRCSSCQSVYELDAKRLAEAAGVVRCGHCGSTFNSLSSLFESHPGTDEPPLSGAGMPPMLDHRAIEQPELPGVNVDDGDLWDPVPAATDNAESGPVLNLPPLYANTQAASPAWGIVGIALSFALLAQLALLTTSSDAALQRWIGTADRPDGLQ